jgi:TolA-binding protein
MDGRWMPRKVDQGGWLRRVWLRRVCVLGTIILEASVSIPCLGQERGESASKPTSSARGQTGQGASRAVEQPQDSGATRPPEERPDSLRFAHELFRRRKFDLAAEEYRRFLDGSPPPALADDARFGLANALLFQGRSKEARDAFLEFLAAAPGHPRVRTAWYRLGELGLMLGDLAEARRALEHFTAGEPGHPNLETAWAYLGDACFALNDLPAARRAYERSLEDFPRGRLADRSRYGLARTLGGLGETQKSLELMIGLAKSGSPEWVERSWIQAARLQIGMGRFAEVVESLEALERVAPRSPFGAEARLLRAEALAKLGRLREAEEWVAPLAAETDPRFAPRGVLLLATILLERGETGRVLGLLEDALRRFSDSPQRPAFLFRLAEALQKDGKAEAALRRFLELAETQPEDPWADDAVARAARLALEMGNETEALRLAESFPTRFSQSPLVPEVRRVAAAARFSRGQRLVENGQWEEAISDLESYLENGSEAGVTAAAWAHLSAAQLGLGRLEEAAAAVDRLAECQPGGGILALARLRLAEALVASGELEKAVDQYRRCLGPAVEEAGAAGAPGGDPPLEPELRLRAQVGLARALALAGKPSEAAKAYGQAAELASDPARRASWLLEQGRCLEAAGGSEEAVAIYERLTAQFRNTPAAHSASLLRARLLARIGRPAEAAAAYETIAADEEARGALAAAGVAPDALIAERASALVEADRPAEADPLFREILDRFPASPFAAEARFHLAESAYQQGRAQDVVALLTPLVEPAAASAASDSPVPPPAVPSELLPLVLYRLGRTRVELGDWSGGRRCLDRLIAEFPQDPRRRLARYLRAEAALRAGDTAAAELEVSALAAEPTQASDPEGFAELLEVRRAHCLLALKRWSEALAAADVVKRRLPPGSSLFSEVELARGRALLGLGRFEEARTALQAVIEAPQSDGLVPQARFLRGESFFHQGRLHEALREFLKVDILDKAPTWQAAALLEAGKVYERLGSWSDAAETYERLLQRFPGEPATAGAAERLAAARQAVPPPPSSSPTAGSR